MNKLKEWYNWFIDLGVEANDNTILARKIRTTNFFVLLAIMASAPSAIINVSNDPWSDRLIILAYSVVNLSFAWLNYRKKHNAARIGLLLLGNLQLFYFSDLQGRESGVPLYFILLTTMPFILFSSEWKNILFTLIIPFVLVGILEYTNYNVFDIERIKTPDDQRAGLYYSICFVIIIFYSSLFYFTNQYLKAEKALVTGIENLTFTQNLIDAVKENNKDSIWIIDEHYKLVNFNSNFSKNFKRAYGRDLFQGYNIVEDNSHVLPESMNIWKLKRDVWKSYYDRALKGENFTAFEELIAGSLSIHTELSFYSIWSGSRKYVAVFSRNISEQKRNEEKISSNLREKELLLKEIHHRVKNNLQIIIGLLQLQEMYIADNDTLKVFKDSENRIKAMALVHELLYQQENLSYIPMKDYMERIASNVKHTFREKYDSIDLKINTEEIIFGVDAAIPLGLITNELLTNAYKYAFEGRSKGDILISLNKNAEDTYSLVFADNGIGIGINDPGREGSLGLNLVHRLAEQINGSVKMESQNGTKFLINFEYPNKA